MDDGIASLRKAIAIRADYAEAHFNLGVFLTEKKDLPGAVAAYRRATELQPRYAEALNNLGVVLQDSGDLPGAVAALRKAIAIRPDYAEAHNNLGAALWAQGNMAGAVAAYRKAIDLCPDHARALFNLGLGLSEEGDQPGAFAAFRKAVELDPGMAEAQFYHGAALLLQGELARALPHLKKGHELGLKRKGWPYPSSQWVRDCERLIELDGKLPAVLRGDAQPADAVERLSLGRLCHLKRLFEPAARLYEEVFAARPDLAQDPQTGARHLAARCAALVGCGRGKEDPPLDEPARARRRKQALDWLRADLELWSGRLERSPSETRASLERTLRGWQRDTDLAGIRDAGHLARLPAEEQEAWRKFWAEVEALRKRAAGRE